MSRTMLTLNGLNFRYTEAVEPLFQNLNITFSYGWTGITGANGSGKSTLLKLITGQLCPQTGTIGGPGNRLYCEQQNALPPGKLDEFYQEFYSGDNSAGKLFSLLQLDHDWPYRWETLSFGERKRAQLAAALWSQPDVLALDEPTNHLDQDATNLIREALSLFQGIGLIISHDRELLDNLCQRTLILDGEGPRLFNCSWTEAHDILQQEDEAKRTRWDELRKQEKKLRNELQRRREENDRHKKDFSKKHLDPKDKDGRAKIDALRLNGADALGGQLVKKMASRVERAESQRQNITFSARQKQGVTIAGIRSKRDKLLYLAGGQAPLGEDRFLRFPELTVNGDDRIAIIGKNGSGKTSLIRKFLHENQLDENEYLFLPQEIPEEQRYRILNEFRITDHSGQGIILSAFSRLNGSARSLLDSADPSPGELRKLSLAMGISRQISLLILDEPTNHLDLPSRLALEEALAGYKGALLLVSHDKSFRKSVSNVEWEISDGELKIL